MVGIGHMRRNLLIAQTLAVSPLRPVILMIAEAREANVLDMPFGGDCLTLPALCKEADGQCRPRYLGVSVPALVSLRARAIAGAMRAFKPDVLIVDHLPRGALGELEPSLKVLRKRGRARCILGMRDVLEDPAVVRQEWSNGSNEEAIRKYYDAVWIYGDPVVYNPVLEYRFPGSVAKKVHFTGYLDSSTRPKAVDDNHREFDAILRSPSERLMLCTVGGGQDGANLAESFADADLPPGSLGVVLTGPFMPADAKRRLLRRAADNPSLRVLEFVRNPDTLLRRADRIIAMGGYNTIYEVLSFDKHALIVPRSRPRHEQRIRAERLHSLGLIDMLSPDQVNPPALSTWLAQDLGKPPRVRDHIDLDGTARLPQLLSEVLRAPDPMVMNPPHRRESVHVEL
jgi:predicted glycosyltransferase